MDDIKNSDILEKLIAYAKSYGGKDSALTAERYLLSVIDFVSGNVPFDTNDSDRSELLDALNNAFPDDSGFKRIKEYLTECVGKSVSSYMDALFMQQCMIKAQDQAIKTGSAQVSPRLVLSCVLEKPNNNIREYLLKAMRAAHEDASVSEAQEQGAVIDIVGKLTEQIKEMVGAQTDAPKEDGSEAEEDDDAQSAEEDPKTSVAKLTENVKNIHDKLIEAVYGQDNAVSVFTSGYFQAELLSLTDKNRFRPKATFLFAGPPGVGKTFLAEKAAEVLELPYQRFDMSEYSDKEANIEFCGSDNVYKNGKEGNVTSFVAKNPMCVILFDEIEKAHINVIHLFLQILDAGRIRDNFTDKEVSFKDAVIFFTTNAGRQLYETSDTIDFSGVTRKVILKALQNDINPETGAAYFPAAICSRFAAGNVVMFNYIAAHNLREIAKKEVLRHAANFEREVGIKVKIDEKVYTSLLFAEGGTADARMIRSRAETFFDSELFELFRLLDPKGENAGIEGLQSISISVDLPEADKKICDLFNRQESYEVLIFSSQKVCEQCEKLCPETEFINAQSIDSAKKVLQDRDISFILVDLTFGKSGNSRYLNIEDVDSKARDFLRFAREYRSEIPVYLLQTPEKKLKSEERLSFMRQGVRGVVLLSKNKEGFSSEIRAINEHLHQQKSMEILAKENKLITFETAQSVKNGGKTAEIKLFDFKMKTAIDAEDSKNVLSNVSKPDVGFDQVIGAEDAKKELKYFVEYLKNPKKYLGTGVSVPKGVLLYGPPGTGKTMLAKAMASESDVTFITAEGNQFINKFQGEGRDRVKEIFRVARKYAPSILFIDEIDAIAKERRGGDNSVDTEATLTAFLTEMDGFKKDTTKPVFVLAATNYDVEPGANKSLDPALMRRFDRRVYIDLPTKEERIRYIRLKSAENTNFELSEDKINNIAIRSTGLSLAELESIIELSLRTAIRDGNFRVTDEIFEEAFETFNGGEAKKWDASQLERVARHEAGHAFLCWNSGETPSYVTIVARGNHGGYMQHDDTEGKMIYTKDELLSRIQTSLGGRAAEIVYYGQKNGISTGASGDLLSATHMARQIICTYGMDEDFGLAVVDQYSAKDGNMSYEIRAAVNKILSEEMQKAVSLIEKNRHKIDMLVERLLADNHVSGREISELFEKENSPDFK